MGLIMVAAGLVILGIAFFQIRNGAVQKELTPFIPDLAAGNGSSASIATFEERSAAVFARHNVTDLKKKRALTNYARIIAKGRITPAQNELVTDMLKQNRVFAE